MRVILVSRRRKTAKWWCSYCGEDLNDERRKSKKRYCCEDCEAEDKASRIAPPYPHAEGNLLAMMAELKADGARFWYCADYVQRRRIEETLDRYFKPKPPRREIVRAQCH